MLFQSTRLLMIVAVTLSASACTWVTLSEAGKNVRIVTADQVSQCQKVGNVSAKTRYHLVGDTERDRKKVQTELDTLARNEASKLQANALVAEGPAVEGQQNFSAYACP